MKAVLLVFLSFAVLHVASSQVRTIETRKTTVDTIRGDTTITHAEIISQSEDITPRSSAIVVNPLKFFLFYNISFVQRLSSAAALAIGVQTPTLSGLSGFGVNGEVRLHPSGKSPRGFYVAPNVSYNRLTVADVTTSPYSVGLLIGWQWFPGDDFAIGLGIGVDYYMGRVSTVNKDFDPYDGTAPALRFDVGYAW